MIFLLIVNKAEAQDFKIIVNKANQVESLSKKEVSNIFLKQKIKWEDKTKIIPVDLSSKSQHREVFSSNIHNKSVNQVRAYWQQSVFAGKASPPLEKSDDAAVIEYVKANKGAIGYVSGLTNTGDVKTITIN